MEATCYLKTSLKFQKTTRRYIPGDRTFHKLKTFEKRALRNIFVSKKEGVIEGQTTLHTEKLHNFTCHQILLRRRNKREADGQGK
jgi:hypothetical protein